jgi:hypothetical protein
MLSRLRDLTTDHYIAIATIILAIVAICTLVRNEITTRRSERAWISVLGAALGAPLEEGKTIRFNVLFQNTGKQPAIDLAFNNQNAVITAPPYDDWTGLSVSKNTSCEGLSPIEGEFVAAPNSGGTVSIRGFDSGRGDTRITADKSLIDGVSHYYIRGCIAYVTFEEIHHTGFCLILQTRFGTESDKLIWRFCPSGNFAN